MVFFSLKKVSTLEQSQTANLVERLRSVNFLCMDNIFKF